jgi:cbb3-type cytochrome oxidase maturation protein
MIDYFFLVPIAIGLGLAGLASFMWTLKNDQYDDLEGAAERILFQGTINLVHETVLDSWHSSPLASSLQISALDQHRPRDVSSCEFAAG